MKIGILSDSHDHETNLSKALDMMKEKKVDTIFHCGDFCAPYMTIMLDTTNLPVHIVFGNTDDRFSTTRLSDKSKNVTLHGEIGEVELDGKKIAFTHFPSFANAFAKAQEHDYVFHGHTHKKREEMIGNTKIINPGEIVGRAGIPSFAILDTKDSSVEFYNLE